MVSAAKLAYRPFGLIAGIVSGMIAGAIFKQVWRRFSDEDEAPSAMKSEYGLGEIVLAATIQGAIFAAVKALVDRLGADGFKKLTGSWPGD